MSHKRYNSISVFLLLALFSASAWSSVSEFPARVYGNLGMFYTGSWADEGARSNSTNYTLSLNANSYVWRPWFATFDMGGTASITKNESSAGNSGEDLLRSYFNFSLLPRSRYPFRFTYSANDNVDEWLSGDAALSSFGGRYQSRYFNARQSFITLRGNRLDGWYTQRTRNFSGIALVDNTLGAKAKFRGKYQNLYANGTYQWRENSVAARETKNIYGTVTHNFFPTSDFYIKTLMSKIYMNDGPASPDSSVFGERKTNTDQMSSVFYWRPSYKPYTTTGGLRAYRRSVDIENLDSTAQIGVDANVAGTYTITRRLRLTATASGAFLQNGEENVDDARNVNQSVLLSYRSDRIRYRGIGYRWHAGGGLGNSVDDANGEINSRQSLNASIGHSVQKNWVTGNRSSLRLNFNQSARESLQSRNDTTALSLSHSASVHWSEEMRRGQFYSQLTAQDTRNIDDDTEMQIINLQVSRTLPMTRLSQWGMHLSGQSSRRRSPGDDDERFIDGFLTTINGRLNYQHARMFGIYRLKFRTRVDVTSTANRNGGDRRQADWQGNLGYKVGKLSTALIGRWVFSDSGVDNKIVYLQLNRSF